MTQTRISRLTSCALLAALAAVGLYGEGEAWAQRGVNIGKGRVYPRFAIGGIYDTNVSNTPDSAEFHASDFILQFRPGVAIVYPSPGANFDLSGELTYSRYLGIDKATSDLSNLAASLGLSAEVNPRGSVSFTLRDNFIRSEDPQYNTLNQRYGYTNNRVGGYIQVRPGGGALVTELGVAYGMGSFDSKNKVDYLNETHVIPSLAVRWKFLPRTAYVLDISLDMARFKNDAEGLDPTTKKQATYEQPQANALKIMTGLLGQITKRATATIQAGYGSAMTSSDDPNTGPDHPDSFNSLIAQLEGSYDIGAGTRVTAGFLRSYSPTAIFGWVGQNSPYLRGSYMFGTKFRLQLGVGADINSYGIAHPYAGYELPAGDERRTDTTISFNTLATYQFLSWARFSAGSNYRKASSNIVSFEYSKAEVLFTLTADY